MEELCCLNFYDVVKVVLPESGDSVFSKTLLPIQQTVGCHFLEDGNLKRQFS